MQVKRLHCLVFICLFFSPIVNANEKIITIAAIDRSVIATFIFDEILKDAYGRIGITIKRKLLPMARSLEVVNQGLVDGEMSRVAGLQEKYLNLIQVPVPVMHTEIVAFGKTDISIDSGWDSIIPFRVAIQNGMKLVESKATQHNWAHIRLMNSSSMFTALLNDRVDLVVTEKVKGLYQLSAKRHENTKADEINLLQPALHKIALYHYLHRKNENILDQLTVALQDMEDEGLIQLRFNQFTGEILD